MESRRNSAEPGARQSSVQPEIRQSSVQPETRQGSAFQSSIPRRSTAPSVRSTSRRSSRPSSPGTAATCAGPINITNMPQPRHDPREITTTRGFFRPKKPYPRNAPRAHSPIRKVPLPQGRQPISKRASQKEKSMAEIAEGLLPPGACNPYDPSTWRDSPINYPPQFLQEWEKKKPRPRPSPPRTQPPEASCGAQRMYPSSPQQFYSSFGPQRVPTPTQAPFSSSPCQEQGASMSHHTYQEPIHRTPSPPSSGSRIEELRTKLSSTREAERSGMMTERHIEATLITPEWLSMPPQERQITPSPRQSPQHIPCGSPPKRNLSMAFEATQAHLPTVDHLGESNRINVENLLRRNMVHASSNIIPVSERIMNTKSPKGLMSEINQIDDFRIEMWDDQTCEPSRSPCANSPQDQSPIFSREQPSRSPCSYSPQDQAPIFSREQPSRSPCANSPQDQGPIFSREQPSRSPCAFSSQDQAPIFSREHGRSPQIQAGNLLDSDPTVYNGDNGDISYPQEHFQTIDTMESTCSFDDVDNYNRNAFARGSPTIPSHLFPDSYDEINWDRLQEESQIIANQAEHGSPIRRQSPHENFGSFSPSGSPTSPRKSSPSSRPCPCTQADPHSQKDEIDWDRLQEESQIIANQLKHGSPIRRQSPPENFGSFSPSGSPTSPRKSPSPSGPFPCSQADPNSQIDDDMDWEHIRQEAENMPSFSPGSPRKSPSPTGPSPRKSPSPSGPFPRSQADPHSQIDDDMDWEQMRQEAENISFDIEMENQATSTPRSEFLTSIGVDKPQIFDEEDDGVPSVVCNEEGVPLSTEQIEQIMREYRMQKLLEERSDLNDYTETEEALQIARDELAACSPCSLRGKQKSIDIRVRPSLIKMNQRYKAFRQKQTSAFSPVQELDENILEPEIIEPEVAAAIMHTEQQGVSFTKSPEKMCEFLFPCEPGEEDEPSIMINSIIQETMPETQGEENDQLKSSPTASSQSQERSSESLFHEAPPIRCNLVQIRGSSKPKWFPGYYIALPWTDDCIHLIDRPSTALHSAWEILKPTGYSHNQCVQQEHSLH